MKNLFSFFREEAVAGLVLGQDYITAACLFPEQDGGIKVANLGWVENEPGTSDRATASLIKKLWRKHGITTRTVCFSIHSPSLVLKYFKYPALSQQELESALQLEAEQIFQKPQEELYIDRYLYPETSTAEKEGVGGAREGILVAVPREEVERHLTILERAGLYPIGLDVGSMAVSNLFLRLKGSSGNKVICLVNVAGHNADFAILDGRSHIYTRNVYSRTSPWQERTDYLVENIRDILRYYQFKLHREPVTEIVFTGGVSVDTKFQEDIKNGVELPVEFWNPLKGITVKRILSLKEIETYGPVMATSLGLAMWRD